jgi:hypothetical protein
MHKLSVDDNMEMLLRRIGSFVYEKRTKDRVGAVNMLAMPAPGTGADVASSWLVGESTPYSREEFDRSTRSHTGRGGGGGGGEGRGRTEGGRGRGTTTTKPPVPPDTTVGPPPGDGGRGRGGGGRGRGRGRK